MPYPRVFSPPAFSLPGRTNEHHIDRLWDARPVRSRCTPYGAVRTAERIRVTPFCEKHTAASAPVSQFQQEDLGLYRAPQLGEIIARLRALSRVENIRVQGGSGV